MNTVKEQLPKTTNLMAVIQCTDYSIGSSLYQEYIDLGIRHIAFNHSSTAYQQFFPHKNISVSKMMGRIYFINKLMENNIIDSSVHHHLLGCAIPDEFKYYGPGYEFIKTLDTSNPVVWGCKGYSYLENITSIEKPKEKIEEFFDKNLDGTQIQLIFNNIKTFKSYLG
jgi:prephenate dehydrogenase